MKKKKKHCTIQYSTEIVKPADQRLNEKLLYVNSYIIALEKNKQPWVSVIGIQTYICMYKEYIYEYIGWIRVYRICIYCI